MNIYLHNTLGKVKQEFKTTDGTNSVRMYSCGPTVYNYAHIGNLRAYVFADILKRTLKYNGYDVKHIVNVTDIGHLTSDADDGEDKMVKALKREGKDMTLENMRSVADFYFEKFREDMNKMNILPANEYPFASDHIREDEEMITTLLEKGFAYTTSDGIYFDTSKDLHYGKLGGISGDIEHSRVLPNSEKRNPQDFALWKYSEKFNDDASLGFGSADKLGKGFPGWHIECSAMSFKYLGVPFDIHTGGIDHISVHHNNEIAQTESATGKAMAHFWMHNEHITIGKDKMAKSGDNFLSLGYLEKNGIDPLAYRYWLLTARYSTRMDYSLDAIKAAQTASQNLLNKLRVNWATYSWDGKINTDYKNRFLEAINNDLDTPKAIALIWEMLKDDTLSPEDKKATLKDFDKVLGLEVDSPLISVIVNPTDKINDLAKKRLIAKENKDFELADKIRDEIKSLGFDVVDDKNGNPIFVKN
jgi:cysteinyl-tRNA synthetase